MSEKNEKTPSSEEEVVTKEEFEIGGGFLGQSLARSPKQILLDRGKDFYIDMERSYRREVEDLKIDLARSKTKQNLKFDFSPTSKDSLLVGSTDTRDVMKEDLEYSLSIREVRIKLEETVERYNYLFGETFDKHGNEVKR